jgi:predicted ATPase
VVVTGGPGAGKTALLELARRISCEHVAVLPESASIVFGGGFPRLRDDPARSCSQRAIFHVQSELEALARGRKNTALVLCDRGTVDGLAYWPAGPGDYWAQLGTSHEKELARYDGVLHLEVPPAQHGYATTAMRIESPDEAASIDDRIAEAWAAHPQVERVASNANFVTKMDEATQALRRLAPACCTVGQA